MEMEWYSVALLVVSIGDRASLGETGGRNSA